jgi:hypothetical protein
MSSVEAPVVTVRAPLTPRLVELLSGECRYVPILTAIALIWFFFGGDGSKVPIAKKSPEPKPSEHRHWHTGAWARACADYSTN